MRVDYQDGLSTTDIINRSCGALNVVRDIKRQLDFVDWAEEIKEITKATASSHHHMPHYGPDYNWRSGDGFFRRRREKRGRRGRLDKKISKENLLIFKKIADKNGLKFWLSFGTLLGAVREKDFIDYYMYFI